MKATKVILLVIAIILSTTSWKHLKAQGLGVELNMGAAYTTQNLAGSDLNLGMGIEALLSYQFMPHTGIYAGWGWNRFKGDQSFAGPDTDFEETGYVLGLQFRHPLGNSPYSYLLRAGALYNHIELENTDGDITEDTGHGWGWQAAAGLDIPFNNSWSLVPSVSYHSLSRDLNTGGINHELDLRHLQLRIGVTRYFR
jgi:hypothetical protein